MAISLRDLAGGGTTTMRDVKSAQNLTYDPFTFRELITPQLQNAPSFDTSSWSNWVDDYEKSRQRVQPSNPEELIATVGEMTYSNREIRAVGSGHSHSPAAAPRDFYVEFGNLEGTLPHNGWLESSVNETYNQRLAAGTVLRDLNRDILAPKDLALNNMGSFDAQTLAGAINTGTHGTGMDLATLADDVQSVDIVTAPSSLSGDPLVRMFRIEPDDGPTDREAFENDVASHHMDLIKDDETFDSVVVGYGAMGIAHSYIMEVRDSFWLREEAELMQWSTLKQKLGQTESSVREFVDDNRHFQFLLHLGAVQTPKGSSAPGFPSVDTTDPLCLIRRYTETTADDKPANWESITTDSRWPPERRKKTARDLGYFFSNSLHPFKKNKGKASIVKKTLFQAEANRKPFVKKREATASYIALRRLRDRKNDPPAPPTDRAISTEVAVPLDQLVSAVDEVIQIVQNVQMDWEVNPVGGQPHTNTFDVYFGAPMGVRFVDESSHHLSAEFDRPSAMVEVPFSVEPVNAKVKPQVPDLTGDEIRDEVAEPALHEIEKKLVKKFDGRPHMGKTNHMDNSQLEDAYDMFDEPGGWMDSYHRFNEFGTFDNEFTKRIRTQAWISKPDRTPTNTPTSSDGPGFGLLTGLSGLAAAGWWFKRHLDGEAVDAAELDGVADPDEQSATADRDDAPGTADGSGADDHDDFTGAGTAPQPGASGEEGTGSGSSPSVPDED